MITVFYDAKCGLCAREIGYYRRIAPDGVFAWQDVSEFAEVLEREGVSLVQALQLLHVKDDAGRLHVGVDAFIVIWQSLRRWRVLALIVGLPIIRPMASWVYRAFAAWRFSRLRHCQLAVREEGSN